MKDLVILVDKSDREIGTMEKMAAHQKGLLHRCFSIFIFNGKGEVMLQKRAKSKYHSGGLWTNTCCSHPRPREDVEDAAHRRLREEMGFDCELREEFYFLYRARLGDLSEHEYDHVFFGRYDKTPIINTEEADGWKWESFDNLVRDLHENSNNYTVWVKIAVSEIVLRKETLGLARER